jgi:hypothetical protein
MVSIYFAVRTREGRTFVEFSGRALMARALRLVVVEFRGALSRERSLLT